MARLDETITAGQAGHISDSQILARKANYMYDVMDFGATGDGVTDDTVAIQAAADAAFDRVNVGAGGHGAGDLYFPPGNYLISDTVDFYRCTGKIRGATPGFDEFATDSGGSIVQWDGDALSPMLSFLKYVDIEISDLTLHGLTASQPTYAIEFVADGDNNSRSALKRVWIGGPTHDIDSGVGYTGSNTKNDLIVWDGVHVQYATTYGLYIPNSQSVWSSFSNAIFYYCGTGIFTNARNVFFNMGFQTCGVDIECNDETTVIDWNSENSNRIANIAGTSSLNVYGGTWMVPTFTGGVMIDMYPSQVSQVALHHVTFDFSVTAANATIDFGALSPAIGFFSIVIDNCQNFDPAMLNDLGTMWSTLTNGSVEFTSYTASGKWAFRNELRKATRPGQRAAIDTSVWDLPMPSGATLSPGIPSVTGTPEGAVNGFVGQVVVRDDGGTDTTLYVKELGTGSTGWVAK